MRWGWLHRRGWRPPLCGLREAPSISSAREAPAAPSGDRRLIHHVRAWAQEGGIMISTIPGPGAMGIDGRLPPPETPISEAELVVSPPLELGAVMELHRWLHETAGAHTRSFSTFRSGDAVLVVSFGKPIPVIRMLAALPFVEEVIPELPPAGAAMGGSGLWGNGRRPRQTSRLRIVLQPQSAGPGIPQWSAGSKVLVGG